MGAFSITTNYGRNFCCIRVGAVAAAHPKTSSHSDEPFVSQSCHRAWHGSRYIIFLLGFEYGIPFFQLLYRGELFVLIVAVGTELC